jgi:hypothetical protein
MLKIKADEELFNEWKEKAERLVGCAGIVQNDMELDMTEWTKWLRKYTNLIKEIETLKVKTVSHIYKMNKPGEEGKR